MHRESVGNAIQEPSGRAQWQIMLRDEVSLLAMPGGHHKTLLRRVHAIHQNYVIDVDELGDLLELADAALAHAIEAILDIDTAEQEATCV